MSTHRVEVVPVTLEPHPNADRLAVVRVFGFTVCVAREQWRDGDLGAYVPPDSVVDTTRPEFAFLAEPGKSTRRIKVRKLRGIPSMGLLIHAPEGAKPGDDVMAALGIEHYEPPVKTSTGGEACAPPPGHFATYDVENFRRYRAFLGSASRVVVTEKIHGSSGRFVYAGGELFAGSRTEWKKPAEEVLWWRAAEQNPWVKAWCEAHPGIALYGEVYGQVQDLTYGLSKGRFALRIFDVLDAGRWAEWDDARVAALRDAGVWAPVLYEGPRPSDEALEAFAEGQSTLPSAGCVREGCVVRAVPETWNEEIGRLQLKIVGNGYMERA